MLLANGLVDKQADQNDPMIVAVILLREDGACLLQHRDGRPGLSAPGLWVFPGGHREKNENSLACARRELEEETTYRAQEQDLFPLMSFEDDFPDPTSKGPMEIFVGFYDGRQEICCREGQACRFVGRKEANLLPLPSYQYPIWDFALLKRASTEPINA